MKIARYAVAGSKNYANFCPSARAARVSYLNFEGEISHEKDYKLHDQLLVVRKCPLRACHVDITVEWAFLPTGTLGYCCIIIRWTAS